MSIQGERAYDVLVELLLFLARHLVFRRRNELWIQEQDIIASGLVTVKIQRDVKVKVHTSAFRADFRFSCSDSSAAERGRIISTFESSPSSTNGV